MLSERYRNMSEDELKKRIAKAKKKLGADVVILCHHYQRDEIFEFADFTGDSFKLARAGAEAKQAKKIVFCGVHFMAESARILASKEQRVYQPEPTAGCPMADLAPIDEVEEFWEQLGASTDLSKVVPVTYMNSSVEVKAFCGRHGGIVCTSSNAGKIFDWAFKRGEKILFIPDENLGRNTARGKGIVGEHTMLAGLLRHSVPRHDIQDVKVILWPGYCHVHTYFTLEHIEVARAKYPNAKIIVHPECREEVVLASDEFGSTEQILNYVKMSPSGSTIFVGTEINMVGRLSRMFPGKKILPLARSLCPNMFKISLGNLCWTLEEFPEENEIKVAEDVAGSARVALERMLSA